MKRLILMTIICIAFFSGCTPVKFYSDSGLSESTGLKYYTVKPYLQVEKDAVSNNVNKTTVLYMPDLENPQFLAVRDGLGSGKADLKLAEGSISTFSLTTESEISKSVEALATLISKGSASLEDLSKLKGPFPGASSSIITELYEVLMIDGVTTLKKIEIK